MFFNFLYIFVIMHWVFFPEIHAYKKKKYKTNLPRSSYKMNS